ncbi:MAG: phage shock protein A [Halanaerobium sp. 4-GBenrich]|jgi:phage shock protein A|uniref:Phage shock protein A (PspA) family protein n=1 Tax=Halanaerobium congolense TaxID=54121 RepID=A0A1G6NWD3_9FIRM|nr:PspA/IM30 family protein [Halanaerobium congolense]KXS48132.1 MAG: phage shock protein A [Halanaerobium sp. T82-1]ODS50900.1 MAG: phage shock protein A [Halanaerobium sp. 4-GBenrich]PUU90867.1 MAG: phage shock protein A [Halanaerobium sp.]TDS26329.1 phage shock protein A (PspA) family protein [Halanaerobium congolense]TDX43718.1 phage shock protein A (PspA) family protein [Halanaerobium congolense]
MKILKRMKKAFEAKMSKFVDEVEDPEELLDISLQEMKEHLQQVQKSLLELTTIKKGLEKDLEDVKDKAELAQQQAQTAMDIEKEDLARAALEKKADLNEKTTVLKTEIEKIENKIEVIKSNKNTLAEQIKKLEMKREELTFINKSADAQLEVKEIITGASNNITDLNEQIKRAEDKINRKEAKLSAIDELVADGELINDLNSGDDIDKSLNQIQRDSKIEEELANLRSKKTGEA